MLKGCLRHRLPTGPDGCNGLAMPISMALKGELWCLLTLTKLVMYGQFRAFSEYVGVIDP